MSWNNGDEAEKSAKQTTDDDVARRKANRPTAIAIEDDGTLERLLSESPKMSAREVRELREKGTLSEEDEHFLKHATIANISFAFDIRAIVKNDDPQAAFEELVKEIAHVVIDTIKTQVPNVVLTYKE
jgi:hypothetical protein